MPTVILISPKHVINLDDIREIVKSDEQKGALAVTWKSGEIKFFFGSEANLLWDTIINMIDLNGRIQNEVISSLPF